MSNRSCMHDTLLSVLYKKKRITYTTHKSYFQSETITNPHDYIHKVEIYTLWALKPWIIFVSDFTFTQRNLLNSIVWITSIHLNLIYMLVWWVGISDTFYMTYIHSEFHYFEANLRMYSLSVILSVIVYIKKISKDVPNLELSWNWRKRDKKKLRSSKVEKSEKKRSLKFILIKLACVMTNACVEIYYLLIFYTFLD